MVTKPFSSKRNVKEHVDRDSDVLPIILTIKRPKRSHVRVGEVEVNRPAGP